MLKKHELSALYAVGLGGVCAGVWGEYGWAWAAIAGGACVLLTMLFALRQRG